MKYTMRENENQTHTLLRHGEPVNRSPNNAELEFWFEIEELLRICEIVERCIQEGILIRKGSGYHNQLLKAINKAKGEVSDG